MVKVAVRGGCVCVGGWWEGWCDVIFNITEGVRTIFFLFWRGVLSKFLLDNSSFSVPPPPDNYCTVPKTSTTKSTRFS